MLLRISAIKPLVIKPLVVAVSISCLVLAGCSDPEKAANNAEIEQLLSRAQSYHLQGQYRAAVIEAKNAIQKDPSSPAAHVLIAQIYSDLGETKEALALLEKLNPTSNADLYIAYIDALIDRGKAKTALEIINTPPVLTPGQKESLTLNTARAQVLVGDFAKASVLYDQLKTSSNETLRNDAATGLAAIAYEAKNATEANRILDAILANSPDYTDALALKAAIAYKNRDLDKAEELLSQALLGLPNTDLLTAKRATVLDSLVNVLTLQGRTAEAMVYTKMLAEARPGSETTKALFEDAIALFKAGKLKEAEQKLLQVYNENNAPDAAGRLLGIIRMQEGDLEGAEQYFSQHIDLETANAETLRLIAENQLRQNNSAEALKTIEENINKAPDNPDLLSIYGLAALAEGDEQKGITAIEKALSLAPDRSKLRAALADYYVRKGDNNAALDQLKKAIEKTPEDFAIRAQHIRQLLFMRQFDAAKQEAIQLEKGFANSAEALSIAASAFLQLKLGDEANATYEKALKLDPAHINSLIGMALLKLQSENWDAARTYVSKVIESDPDNIRAYKIFAAISAKTNTLTDYLDRLVALSKEKVNAWGPDTSLAEYYFAKGEVEKAIAHEKEALARSGFKGYAKSLASRMHIQLARQQSINKNFTEARRYLLEGLQIDPKNIEMLDMLAHVEINAEKFTEVDKISKQIRESHPNSIVPDLIDSDKLRKQGNKKESLQKLQQLWAKAPNDAIAIRMTSLLDSATVDAFANEWMEKRPDSADARVFYAMQMQSKGKVEEARAGYEKALSIAPNEPRALNNLAWILFERKQMKEALALSAKAVSIAPDDAAILDTHGWILFNNGDKETAQKVLKKASELAPGAADVQEHYQATLK